MNLVTSYSQFKKIDLDFRIKALEMILAMRYHKQPKLRDIKKRILIQQVKYFNHSDQKLRAQHKEELDFYDKKRWARQLKHPLIDQKKLKGARIAVFGLGGIGTNILIGLSYSGIKNFKIIDSDSIDLSNLNRQTLYFEHDINYLKCDKAINRLLMINPKMNIKAYNLAINYPVDLNIFDLKEKEYPIDIYHINEIIKWADYIINAVDFNGAPYLINDLCVKNEKPFFWAGVNHSLGEIYNYFPNEHCACLRCIFGPDNFLEKNPFLRYKTKKTQPYAGINIGTTVIITGSLISELIIQDICGFPHNSHGKYLIFNAINHKILKIPVQKHEKCVCSNNFHYSRKNLVKIT